MQAPPAPSALGRPNFDTSFTSAEVWLSLHPENILHPRESYRSRAMCHSKRSRGAEGSAEARHSGHFRIWVGSSSFDTECRTSCTAVWYGREHRWNSRRDSFTRCAARHVLPRRHQASQQILAISPSACWWVFMSHTSTDHTSRNASCNLPAETMNTEGNRRPQTAPAGLV